MTDLHTFNLLTNFVVRPSDILLDRVFNPASDATVGSATPAQLAEACGIIPDFFAKACLAADPLTLDNIAAGMDDAYHYGGFNSYPYKGTVDDHDGTYRSEHKEDEELPPLARFIYDNSGSSARAFECFVYRYAIVAIRDRASRQTKIARFD